MAAEVIPPAYPAPSPQGYSPRTLLSISSFLQMRTGEEVRLSIPANRASGAVKAADHLPKALHGFQKRQIQLFRHNLPQITKGPSAPHLRLNLPKLSRHPSRPVILIKLNGNASVCRLVSQLFQTALKGHSPQGAWPPENPPALP